MGFWRACLQTFDHVDYYVGYNNAVLQSRPQQHVHETLFDAVRRVPECRNPLTRVTCVLALQRLRLRLESKCGNRKTELVVRSVKEPVRDVKGQFEEACSLVLGIQSHDKVLNTLDRFAKTVPDVMSPPSGNICRDHVNTLANDDMAKQQL
ncbi:hypothetical protein MY3296_002661 [Beauveria thailandica]